MNWLPDSSRTFTENYETKNLVMQEGSLVWRMLVALINNVVTIMV